MVEIAVGSMANILKVVPEVGVRLDALKISVEVTPAVNAECTIPVGVQVVGVMEYESMRKNSLPDETSLTCVEPAPIDSVNA
jgi:hypothetical protein